MPQPQSRPKLHLSSCSFSLPISPCQPHSLVFLNRSSLLAPFVTLSPKLLAQARMPGPPTDMQAQQDSDTRHLGAISAPHLSNTSTKTRSIAEHLPIQPPTLIWLPSGSSGSTAKWAPPPVFESWSSASELRARKPRGERGKDGQETTCSAGGACWKEASLPTAWRANADRVALGEHEELRDCSAHERARMGLSPSPRNWSLMTRGVARSVGGVEWRRWS